MKSLDGIFPPHKEEPQHNEWLEAAFGLVIVLLAFLFCAAIGAF